MPRITGAQTHINRLRRIAGPEMVRGVGRALYAGAQAIQVEAQHLITEGAVSGKNHVPSLPGEPPNNDTGVLAGNIEALQTAPLKAETSSNAPYAVELELGTSRMAERPSMGPAAAKKRREVTELVQRAVSRVVRS